VSRHDWRHSSAAVHDAVDVDGHGPAILLQGPVEGVPVQREELDIRTEEGGVVDQDVYGAEFPHRRLDHGGNAFRVRHVDLQGHGRTALGHNLLRGFLSVVCDQIGDYDLVSMFGERTGVPLTDTSSATGDNGYSSPVATFGVRIHRPPPLI